MGAKMRQAAIRNVICGENVVIYDPVNLYDCELAEDVFIGPFVEIGGIRKSVRAAKSSLTVLSANM